MVEFNYMPDWRWLAGGGLALLALLLWSYWRAAGRPGPALRLFLAALRALAFAAVILCLLNPQRVEEIRHPQTAQVAVLLDSSRSMGVKDGPETRLETAQRWLQQQLAPAWTPRVTRADYAFGRSLQLLPKLDSASPTGGVTALAGALESLLAASTEPPLAGVILCSDGLENAGRDPLAVAKAFRRKGIPIYTLACGATNEMRDIVLENVQVKRAVPHQAPTRLGIALRAPGYAGQTVPVQIRHGRDVVAQQEIKLSGGPQRFEMDFTPRQKGFQTYEVLIPLQPQEWLAANNRRVFGLEVVDPTIRVIYMEGTPQQSAAPIPEWKYLKDALQSDPNIKVKALYSLPTAGGFNATIETDPDTGDKVYPVNHSTRGFPRTLADLLKYDVIIHSDIKVQVFTPEQLQIMARFVEQYGGGFVMVGGNSAFGRGGYQKTIIDRISPVAMQQFADSTRMTFKMRVPPEILEHPVMAIGATREETLKIWIEKLPQFRGLNRVDHAKPGAIVLGETPAGAAAGYGQRVVLAVQDIGRGRSMAFTSDITRTWGEEFETLWGERLNASRSLNEANCDSRYYRAFWINAVRWLAAGKAGPTNNPVTLELAQSYALPNQPVAATVMVRNAEGNELTGAEVSLTLSVDGTNKLAVKPAFDSGSRAYTAQLRPLLAGNYLVTAEATLKNEKLGEDRQLLMCEDADQEMTDVRARPDLMAEIARISGGKSLSLRETGAADFATLFGSAPPPPVSYRRTPVWDQSWLLGCIIGLLSLEWALRRWRGLA